MALELVTGADFWCKLMSRGSPGDLGWSRGRFPVDGRRSPATGRRSPVDGRRGPLKGLPSGTQCLTKFSSIP